MVSSLTLDPPTFLLCVSLSCGVMSVLCSSTASTVGSNISGLREWSRGMLSLSLAFLFFFLRGHAPRFLTHYMANMMWVAGVAMMLIACCRYLKLRMPYYYLGGAVTFAVTGIAAWYLLNLTNDVVVFFGSTAGVLLLGRIAYTLIRHSGAQLSLWSTRAAIAALVLVALGLAVRSLVVLASDGTSVDLYAKSQIQFWFMVTGGATVVCASMGLILMAHDRHNREILECSRRDGLTGLYTNSAFFESASGIDASARWEPHSVIMIDIDHFKNINDSYGHAVGDLAIAHAARLISQSIRSTDVAGRYGGEEFCVLLRGCDKEQAGELAKRLVREAENCPLVLPDGRELKFTMSAGYAGRNDVAPEAQASDRSLAKVLLEKADQALYRAKNGGRNQAQAA